MSDEPEKESGGLFGEPDEKELLPERSPAIHPSTSLEPRVPVPVPLESAPAFGAHALEGIHDDEPGFGTGAADAAPARVSEGVLGGELPVGMTEAQSSEAGADAPPIGIGDLKPLPPERLPTLYETFRGWIRDYFLGDDINFGLALVPYCFLSMLLFTRHPTKTNFIFDEQEALLANPYVRSVADANPKFHWLDAFHRDFWGLGPERSIGSYRPIPDLIWRALWALGARDQTPFLHHWVNVLLHGVNGALVCILAFKLTKRRGTAWIAGALFTAAAVLTEAVSGVVGIADVLGATGTLIALLALTMELPWMPLGVILGTLFGLYSKESALCCVPLLPLGALLLSPLMHPRNPQRWLRAIIAFIAAGGAFVFYVYMRRWQFPTAIPPELSVEANAAKPFGPRMFAAILRWYAQPVLPKDPLNNPLVNADGIHRVGGALRVWFRGLTQVVFPLTLSGDYSAPQEPIPPTLFAPEIILGGILMVLPFPLAAWLGIRGYRRWKAQPADVDPTSYKPDLSLIIAFGALWAMISYFPVSNIPVLLPTVRAERFWYFPVIGTSLILAVFFAWTTDWLKAKIPPWLTGQRAFLGFIVAFFLFQGFSARKHANDYTDDLSFWDATRKAVPRSAKAHLNYSVMKGARGDLNTRLESNGVALQLAPDWPMASVYYGDTLCRLHRAHEAWPYYAKGFELAPNDVNLIALGLQCLWDEKVLTEDSPERGELDTIKDKHPGSWLEFLGRDILEHGEEHNGVDPKYRPRGYNEGPKDG